MPAHKKTEVEKKTETKKKTDQEPTSVVTQPTEGIEVAGDVAPKETKQEAKVSDTSENPEKDLLTAFKEKMNEEEKYSSNPPARKNFMWPILLIFVITIALLVGIFAYRQGIFESGKEEVNVVSLSPTPTVTPEPTKAVDLTQYEIEILNGSEVSGEAARQKDNLEGEGFDISSIGNADNSDYTDTIIQAKENVDKDFLAKLESVLSDTFTLGETETLSEDSSVPIIVILGTKK